MRSEIQTGVAASERLLEARDRVLARVSYLRSEVGAREVVPIGTTPLDGEWMSCADLASNPEWLATIIAHTGRALGTDDQVVAASIFVQNYAYRIMTLAIAYATTSGVVPDAAAASMALSLKSGRPSNVAYVTPSAMILCEHADQATDALLDRVSERGALEFIIVRGLREHLALLVVGTRQVVRIGQRLLWGNIAASCAVAFRTMEGSLGDWVRPLGERFFGDYAPELKGHGSFLALEVAGRRGWYWERTTCCLYDRLPGDIRCGDCSRTPVAQRRAAYRVSLEDAQ